MEIQTATIVSGTESPAGDGLNGAIRCIITLQDGSKRRAVVKRGSPGNILAEVFAAFLLRGWGLSVPDPFLIHENGNLAFASADIQYPNLKQAFNFDGIPDNLKQIAIVSAIKVVCSLPSISLAAACDETIDNRDRNLGNVLWDGENESWIDHAFSLGHGTHMLDVNKLCAMACEIPELTQNIQMGAVASGLCLNRNLPGKIQDLLDKTPLPSENMVEFISERLASIGNRIIARFPNLSIFWLTYKNMTHAQNIYPWRALYWEPVADTGERLMVGVVYQYSGNYKFTKTIRDDILIGLFGKHHQGITKLINHNLEIYANLAQAANSIEVLSMPIGGLHPGPMRVTEAFSSTDILQTACLLYSSLGNLDKFDELDESDAPQQEEVNKRFGSEIKTVVAQVRPDLAKGFGRSSQIIHNGISVKFGFLSLGTALHFTVINPVRQSASVRDARARIFELQRAKEYADLQIAALIAAVPRADDATLGSRQREQLLENQKEIENEAGAVNLTWISVNTAQEGAVRLMDLVGQKL